MRPGSRSATLAYVKSHWKDRQVLAARAEMLRTARRR
jgi:uncharacterized protein YbdZ (MbtH family)